MIFNAYSDMRDSLFDISIVSAGHIFAKTGRRINRPKGRGDFLLFYVARGTERFYLENEVDLKDGSFIFFRPCERQQHICVSEGGAEFYYVHFNAPEDFELFGLESFRPYFGNPSAAVRDIFERIISELELKEKEYEKICALKLIEIILNLSRRLENESVSHPKKSGRIPAVIQLINREYAEEHSLLYYASAAQMSKFHFLRVFKEIVGVSPIEYKNKIRIEHSKELLEDESIPIGEVGMQVGFSSAAYFSDAFKKKVGMSPAEYRKSLK